MPALKPRGTLLNAPDYVDRIKLIKKMKVDGNLERAFRLTHS